MPGTYISPAETGLYYLNSRYYDPETCRFINADSYVATGQGIVSYNMFAYGLNNPINFKDPSGHIPESVLRDIVVGGMAEFAQATINEDNIITRLVPSPYGRDILITNDYYVNYMDDKYSNFVVVVDIRINNGNIYNPDIKIIDSYKISSDTEQYYILLAIEKYVKENPVKYSTENEWNRSIDSMKIEWDVHNFAYYYLSFIFDKELSAHVDFDYADAEIYDLF